MAWKEGRGRQRKTTVHDKNDSSVVHCFQLILKQQWFPFVVFQVAVLVFYQSYEYILFHISLFIKICPQMDLTTTNKLSTSKQHRIHMEHMPNQTDCPCASENSQCVQLCWRMCLQSRTFPSLLCSCLGLGHRCQALVRKEKQKKKGEREVAERERGEGLLPNANCSAGMHTCFTSHACDSTNKRLAV